jgi:HlyD family secretion protein
MANAKSKRRRKLLIFSAIVLVLGGLTAAALLRKREPVVTVQTEKAERRNITEIVLANGRIQPVRQVKISAEVSGEIIELPVKEGQPIRKGDLLVKIKPDTYIAQKRSMEASYLSAVSGQTLSEANLRKAQLEFARNQDLFQNKLISDSVFLEYKTALDVAKAQVESSGHQVDVAKASLARTDEELAKTTIYSPIDGTVSKLNLELGERVAGNTMMAGTEIMTVANLNEMEARVDIGEIDIPLIAGAQNAKLEVDAFRDRKFKGTVSEIANSSKTASVSGQSQDATKFEVKIRINEVETFRPGMTVTAEIETRYRSNVLAVPVQSVTTRPPKKPEKGKGGTNAVDTAGTNAPSGTNTVAGTNAAVVTNAAAADTPAAASTNAPSTTTNTASADPKTDGKNSSKSGRKADEKEKPIEVVFVVDGDKVKMVPVKRGIADDAYVEILEGVTEGQEVVSGGYKAISRDLEDGKKIHKGVPEKDKDKDKDKK